MTRDRILHTLLLSIYVCDHTTRSIRTQLMAFESWVYWPNVRSTKLFYIVKSIHLMEFCLHIELKMTSFPTTSKCYIEGFSTYYLKLKSKVISEFDFNHFTPHQSHPLGSMWCDDDLQLCHIIHIQVKCSEEDLRDFIQVWRFLFYDFIQFLCWHYECCAYLCSGLLMTST